MMDISQTDNWFHGHRTTSSAPSQRRLDKELKFKGQLALPVNLFVAWILCPITSQSGIRLGKS